jgi:polar amino acid transport system substrate-binding protein
MRHSIINLRSSFISAVIFSLPISTFANSQATVAIPILIAVQTGDKDQELPISKLNSLVFNYFKKTLDVTFDVRHYPWRRVLYNGENGEGIIFGIYKTPSRIKIFNFSEPVYTDKVWLVSLCKKQFPFNKIQDLVGKKIGIVPGSSAGEEFDNQVGKTIINEKNDTSLAGRFLKLYQNRMDAFLLYEPRTNLIEVQKELNLQFAPNIKEYSQTKKDLFCILPHPISSIEVHFALSKKANQAYLDKINHALIKAKKNGDLNQILAY